MIRFHVQQANETIVTEWVEESVTHGTGPQTAVVEMEKLRQQYPDAAIRIERTTVVPKPDRNQVRFRITLPNNETRYSKVVDESEAETLLTQLHKRFPQAKEISRG